MMTFTDEQGATMVLVPDSGVMHIAKDGTSLSAYFPIESWPLSTIGGNIASSKRLAVVETKAAGVTVQIREVPLSLDKVVTIVDINQDRCVSFRVPRCDKSTIVSIMMKRRP